MQKIYLEVHPVMLEPQETAGKGNKTAASRSHMSLNARTDTGSSTGNKSLA